MKSGASIIADSIERVVDYKLARLEPRTKTVTGIFVGKDDEGKAWVRLSGANGAIPIRRMSVQANVGDTVSVTVGGGRAVVYSNVSNPSASSTTVAGVSRQAVVAHETAVKAVNFATEANAAAAAAKAGAATAASKAEEATRHADTAKAGADSANAAAVAATADAATAHAMAESATNDAAVAKVSADAATAEASRAMEAANDAYAQLGDVEKIVDTLGWFAEHAARTQDTAVQAGKTYYTFDGYSYRSVAEPSDDDMWAYVPTEDTAVQGGKTYYSYDGTSYSEVPSPTDAGIRTYAPTSDTSVQEGKAYYALVDGSYVQVEAPTDAGMGGYYEMTVNYYERDQRYYELDATIQNYVASHLALTDDGLYLVTDDSEMRLHLATDGVHIVSSDGMEVASFTDGGVTLNAEYGEGAFFGRDESDESGIWRMEIDNASIGDMLAFGNFSWIRRDNGNMALKWLGD